LAVWSVLDEVLARPLVMAGYSVGEVAAWGVAGVVDAATLFALAAERADAMDEATKQPAGLLSLRGLSRHDVNAICKARHTHIAIIDGPETFLIGGTDASLKAAANDADAHGAQHTTRLAVAVPSHTPLLQTASEAFRKILCRRVSHVKIPGDIRLLSGIDGGAMFSEAGLDKLAEQVAQTVNWVACMDACQEAGVTKAIEFGPGAAQGFYG
jgi:[acyl-carrier-protein] S-malonyltransferase